MAKRKRLEMPSEPISPDLETKSAFPAPRSRMPIADVAGDTAGRAALEEVAREMTLAEDEGRVVKKLALDDIELHHLSRDRMVLDEGEMAALKASIEARGQQTPIEVVRLASGAYGLISGLRRVEALRQLGETQVLALVKKPEGSQEAYQAMVEENEIRAALSFYERANIARAAVGQGVYPDPQSAVKGLFANAPKARRSKILKFVTICEHLGDFLHFPTAVPEHLGLALAGAVQEDPKIVQRISAKLGKSPPRDAAEERRILEAVLKRPAATKAKREELLPGLTVETKAGRAVLAGPKVDAAFLKALRAWAVKQAS